MRNLHGVDSNEIVKLKLRTVLENWYVGVCEKTKQAYSFDKKDIDNIVFANRDDALRTLKKIEKEEKIND